MERDTLKHTNMAIRKKAGYLSLTAILCSMALLAGCNKTEKDADSMVDNSSWNNSVTEGTNGNNNLNDNVDNERPDIVTNNNQENNSSDKNVVGDTQDIGDVIENTIDNVTNAIENAADTAKDTVTDDNIDTGANTTKNTTRKQNNVVQNRSNKMSSNGNRTTVNR